LVFSRTWLVSRFLRSLGGIAALLFYAITAFMEWRATTEDLRNQMRRMPFFKPKPALREKEEPLRPPPAPVPAGDGIERLEELQAT